MIDLKNNALLSSPVCVRRRRPPTATELMNSPSPCCETLTRGGGYRPGLSSSRTPVGLIGGRTQRDIATHACRRSDSGAMMRRSFILVPARPSARPAVAPWPGRPN
jgi:hypothetical protein